MLPGKAIFAVLVLVVAGAGAGAYFLLSDSGENEVDDSYVLSFDTNGGTGTFEDITFSDSSYTDTIPNTEPVRKNTQFKEWNTKADGTGTAYEPNGSIDVPENTTLYAVYAIVLSFDSRGGTGAFSDMEFANSDETKTIYTEKPSMDGATFREWNTKTDGTGTAYGPGDSVSPYESTVLYAVYDCSLRFENEYGSGFSVTVPLGSAYTFTAAESTAEANFDCWTESAGSGTLSFPAGSEWTVNRSASFDAQYTSDIAYFGLDGSKTFTQSENYPGETKLLSPDWMAGSWKVLAWNTAKDGSGTEYGFGADYTVRNTNLYAVERDRTTADAAVGTSFEYDVTGAVLKPEQYPVIKNAIDLINSTMENNSKLKNYRITIGLIGISGTYTHTISGIDAETGNVTYTREGLVDVSIPFVIQKSDGTDIGKITLSALRFILNDLLKLEDGNLLSEFIYPIKDVSITSTDGFSLPGEIVTNIIEIDEITSEGEPYLNTVLGKEVLPVNVMKMLETLVVDKLSKIVLSADIKIPTQLNLYAKLSGYSGTA